MSVRTQIGADLRSSQGRPVRDSPWSGQGLDITVTALTEQQADLLITVRPNKETALSVAGAPAASSLDSG